MAWCLHCGIHIGHSVLLCYNFGGLAIQCGWIHQLQSLVCAKKTLMVTKDIHIGVNTDNVRTWYFPYHPQRSLHV